MSAELETIDYAAWLRDLKVSVRQAQSRVARAAHREMICVYWLIGRGILERQNRQGWGAQVIDRLSADLTQEFPSNRSGFSPRNLKYMRAFAAAWDDPQIVQQLAAQLPWGHHLVLLDKVQPGQRVWYARACAAEAWSRAILVHQIDTQLHERQGAASDNFATTMPAQRAVLASSAFKDPYILGFVELGAAAHERHLEAALVNRIQNLLLEMGSGFAFIGNQYRLQVGERDFYVDLLFYHTKLHSYVVVELKLGDFEPEYVSKMGFYLTAVDAQVASPNDNPSIGLLLCRGKDGMVVEYALRTTAAPMAVATYRVLPPGMEAILPAAEEIERVLMEKPEPARDALPDVEADAMATRTVAGGKRGLARAIVGIAAASGVAVQAGYVELLERYGDDEQLRSILSGIGDLEDDLDAFVRGHGVDIPEPRP